jgi:hypothetical protein
MAGAASGDEVIHGDGSITHGRQPSPTGRYLALLSLATLGVVYGGIGTSPSTRSASPSHPDHEIAPSPANVLGVLSLIIWALIVIVSIEYLVFILRADNRGEGGILALTALVTPVSVLRRGGKWFVIMLGLFGGALLYGESLLTPSIGSLRGGRAPGDHPRLMLRVETEEVPHVPADEHIEVQAQGEASTASGSTTASWRIRR